MSQYRPEAKDASKEIFCGFDDGLQTFFISYGIKDSDKLDMCVGTAYRQLTSFDEFLDLLALLTVDRGFALGMAKRLGEGQDLARSWIQGAMN